MGRIIIREILTHAYHGCLPSEKKIGGEYKITLWIDGDFTESEKTDLLEDTVDYDKVVNLVSHEMRQSSNLIENVAYRIANKMMLEFSKIKKLKIKVIKITPPVSAEVPQVEYLLEKKR